MAGTKPINPVDDAETQVEGVTPPDVAKINEIIEHLHQEGGSIRLTRHSSKSNKYAFVARIDVADWDIEDIARKYGGGKYRAQTHRANGAMYKPFEFEIDDRIKGELDQQLDAKQESNESSISGMNATMQFMEKMGFSGRETLDRMLEMANRKEDKPQMDYMPLLISMMTESQKTQAQMMTGMMTAMASMVQASMSGKQSTDPLEFMKFAFDAKSAENPTENALRMISMAKEIVNNQQDSDEPMWKQIVAEAGKALGGAFGGGQSVPEQDQPKKQLMDNRYKQMVVGKFINNCVKGCQRGVDPVIYYEMLVDSVSEDDLNEVKRNLTSEGWFALLFGEEADRFEPMRPWFTILRNLIISDGKYRQPPNDQNGSAQPEPEPDSPPEFATDPDDN